jgi:2'-5' RNA ligase
VVSYFVVSFLPDRTAERLAALARCLPGGIAPQTAQRMHLTYRSFDGLPHGLLDPLKQGLSEVALRHKPILATLRGAGAFDAGAVWARVRSGRVCALHVDIDAVLDAIGLPPASHPFVPHVTLGTGPAGAPAPACLDRLWMVTRLDAIALTTTGSAAYRTVRWFPLGRPSDDADPRGSEEP